MYKYPKMYTLIFFLIIMYHEKPSLLAVENCVLIGIYTRRWFKCEKELYITVKENWLILIIPKLLLVDGVPNVTLIGLQGI